MNMLNNKSASLWRHLGFRKNFSHLSHFEKEHFSLAIQSDIQAINLAIREAQNTSPDPSIKEVFTTELNALETSLEALKKRKEEIDESVELSREENNAAIRSFLLSGKGFITLDTHLRASIISHLDSP